MDEKTYRRPPLVPTKKTPRQILSEQDQIRLGRHYKSYLDKDKDSRKTKSFQYSSYSDEEKAEIASIYEMMREQYGFYPNGIDSSDRIIWGIALKSDTQILFEKILFEKYGEEYRQRGEEVMEEHGAFAGKFQERKDEMAD